MDKSAEELAKEEELRAEKEVAFQAKIDGMEKMLKDGETARDQLLQELKDSKQYLSDPDYIEYLDKKSGGGEGSEGETKSIDDMSRTEFAATIHKGITDILTDAAKGWDEQMKDIRGELSTFSLMADVEFNKLRTPAFAELLSTDEGKERYVKLKEENPTWSSKRIYDDIKKEDIVTAKEEADLKVAQAKEEKDTWSEKPEGIKSVVEEKNLSDEESTGKIYDAIIGNTEHPSEETAGVVLPMKD